MNLPDRFASSLDPSDSVTLEDVRGYIEWSRDRQSADFTPRANDDVELRTYFLFLRNTGADRRTIQRTMASLKRFYAWAVAEGLVASSPYDRYNLEHPILSPDQVRRRRPVESANPQEFEIARLRALNLIADQLNRTLDLQTMLRTTMETVLRVMGLKTAWAFLLGDSGMTTFITGNPPHDFVLAEAVGLPAGLKNDNEHYLRQPPDCHCQSLLRAGHLMRAVNIVECTRLQNSAEAQGDNEGLFYHASVPLTLQGRPVGILNFATEEYQFLSSADLELLSAVGAQVSAALERARLYDLAEVQRTRLAVELEMARAVQETLVPDVLPNIPGIDLAVHWWCAREVGGDFYDIFPLPGNHWGMMVGDVSDKGAPAALYMAMTLGLIRSRAEHVTSPAELLSQVNHALVTQSTSDMFVTAFYAILDPAARTLTFANAGHSPPVLRRAAGGMLELRRTGMALGVFDDLVISDNAVQLVPGDALISLTDGVTDAQNRQGDEYGAERLKKAIAAAPTSADQLLDAAVSDLTAFTQGVTQTDDITILVMTVL